jgi:hypothetical protein
MWSLLWAGGLDWPSGLAVWPAPLTSLGVCSRKKGRDPGVVPCLFIVLLYSRFLFTFDSKSSRFPEERRTIWWFLQVLFTYLRLFMRARTLMISWRIRNLFQLPFLVFYSFYISTFSRLPLGRQNPSHCTATHRLLASSHPRCHQRGPPEVRAAPKMVATGRFIEETTFLGWI